MTQDRSEQDQRTVELYDADDVSQFYKIVVSGGGDCFHYGIFESPDMTPYDASINTVKFMQRLAESAGVVFDKSVKILDEGAGNGGPAHILAQKNGAHVTCLNLCKGQNAQNEERARELGIADQIDVVHGSFDELPDEWTNKFDIIWSQDAYDHSNCKRQVLAEAFRALKPGGHLVFTDIMASALASAESLAIIKDRLRLNEVFTIDDYERELPAAGFKLLRTRDLTSQLIPNYRRMHERCKSERSRLDRCSDEFIERYRMNLQNNVKMMTEQEAQTWYAFVAQKPMEAQLVNGLNGHRVQSEYRLKRYVATKLHNIGVTHKNVKYHGSAGICKKLMKQVGLQPYEAVDVANCRNGMRWTTYVIPEDDEGSFKLNGAAGRLGEIGDECIVFTYVMSERYEPALVVCLDPNNGNAVTDQFHYDENI